MQSAAPHVLRALDRLHTPGRATAAAIEAREAGCAHVSVDLIYGTHGETDEDWMTSLEAALSARPDHLSAYALTVEPGTKLAAGVRRGVTSAPDDETQARRFVVADERLGAAGLHWYEVSSWARDDDARCRHNLGYWASDDWWGIGPGAHSHVAGVRWWNVRRPAEYARRLHDGELPVAGREVLSDEDKALEAVMLGIRVREGLALSRLRPDGARAACSQAARGRVTVEAGRVRLTREGRLFADEIARDLSA
jgi:oxygen-independent coproporphyrinogen-3 oxidase